MRILIPAVAMWTLSGCASLTAMQPLAPDHPASAAAPESPPAERSMTLAVPEADPMAPAGAAAALGGAPTEAGSHVLDPNGPAHYACPMHPEVTSDQPGQRCPICHMALRPVESSPGGPR